MTNKDMIYQAIAKAVADGASKFIRASMGFTVLLGVIAGLSWGIMFQYNEYARERAEMKSEIRELRAQYEEEVKVLRAEIAECNKARAEDSARIARLETTIQRRGNR